MKDMKLRTGVAPTIIMLHGTNSGPWLFDQWRVFFEKVGYDCHCPAYRFHSTPEELKQSVDKLVGLSINDYVEDIEVYMRERNLIRPIVMGFSLGGIVAQKLASKQLTHSIILLNGSVNHGILPTTPEEQSLGKMFIGAFWDSAPQPDFETMSKFSLNKLPSVMQQRAVFDRLGPESGRVLFELFFWAFDENSTTLIDYDSIGCPVMMVSGTEDLAIPPSTSKQIAEKQPQTFFYEAKDHGHSLMLETGWERIAKACLEWIQDA